MPNSDTTELGHVASEGAIVADHQQVGPQPVLVGPTTASEFNTMGERLLPKGCFRFEDVLFEFDSSFVRPEAAKEMPLLADLRDRHMLTLPGPLEQKIPPPLSIFGHADPVSNDDYNKQLSGRRSLAIYAMLVRDVELWDDLFTHPLGGDNWGNPAIQTMLITVSPSLESADGPMGTQSQDNVKAFQSENGLAVDGVVGPNTRKALYLAYMNALCGPRLLLDKGKDFLAHHKDAGGKGDYQGCSEFNPVVVFSQKDNSKYEHAPDKRARNADNAPNRRVMVLMFAPGRRVNPQFWPCPRVKEGVSACKKRFFPDADHRRSCHDKRREFDNTKDTFACRFYQLITDDSPCEHFLSTFSIRLYDNEGRFIAWAPFELTVSGKQPFKSRANGEGIAIVKDVEIPNQVRIEWGFPPKSNDQPELIFGLDMFLKQDGERQNEAMQKLNNLGYALNNPPEENVAAFQRDYAHLATPRLLETGDLEDSTMALIRDVHASCEDDLRNTKPIKKEGGPN